MNSPVLHTIQMYIRLDRSSPTPIYQQIAHGIINAIHTEAISFDTKLPGTRKLCKHLHVHRNTIVAAYDELSAQGWIDIKPQKGALVAKKKLENSSFKSKSTTQIPISSSFVVEKNIILDLPNTNTKTDYFFTDGTADHRLMPIKEINQLLTSIGLKKNIARILNKSFHEENENLKEQLINYLHVTKNLAIHPRQILITQSQAQALQTIIQTVLRPKDKIVIIEPGNYAIHMKLKQAGLDIIPIRVDQQGIDFDALIQLFEKYTIRAIYVHTNQLYPTTDELVQKEKLVDFANRYNCVVIEDGNSTDFVYDKTIPNTLKKIDTYGSVIYYNSLQDLLPSPYNIGYILAPNNVISELTKVKNTFQNSSNYLVEESIAEYIKEGFLLRQIQRNTKTYLKRRDHFQQLLSQNLEQNIHFETPKIGLAFWVTFNTKLPLLAIAKYCETVNLTIPNYLLYQNQNLTAMRVGFGHMNETEAEQCISILSKAIYQHMYK